jgi:sugar lactone lactonase YvrE
MLKRTFTYPGIGANALAVDAKGHIYVSFLDSMGQESGFATFNQRFALVRSVDLPSGAGSLAISVDSAQKPYVLVKQSGFSTRNAVEVFAADAEGQASPIRTIAGSRAKLNDSNALAVDRDGNVYVTNAGGEIQVFRAGANGNVAPAQTISGSSTGLTNPIAITLGGDQNMYVANSTGSGYDVLVFPFGATGNVSPIRVLQSTPYGTSIALDSQGRMYLGPGPSKGTGGFAIFAPGASGNDAPVGFIGPTDFGPNQYPGSAVLREPWYVP